jgi:hypothetical protein
MGLSKEEKERRKQERKNKKWNNEHRIINNIVYKLCSIHKEYFPNESIWILMDDEHFYKNDKNGLDGFSNRCKRCEIKRSRQNQIDNPERTRENKARWHRENQEHKLDLGRKWVQEHPEERREYLKNYYHSNPEKHAEYRRKREMHKHHEISDIEWDNCKKYFDYKCACCGKPISEHYHRQRGKMILFDFCKDHFVNDGSNDLTNCIPLCKTCNGKKNTKTFEEFYNNKNKYYTEERLDKIYKWIYEDCFNYLESKTA